jgi:hypothetical protein
MGSAPPAKLQTSNLVVQQEKERKSVFLETFNWQQQQQQHSTVPTQ